MEKPDSVYLITVMMSSCVLLSYPYDLPPFVPALLSSFVRHVANPALRDVVMRTVQEFKRTHQDRWSDFKKHFTHEQLDDIQGAGAAHYFS
jgi:proteasome activator subunit 4